jgi:glycosyltransferase involved in cell wall biosynthesis
MGASTQGQMTIEAGVPGLVSILIPVYNRAHLIEETVQSALAQTYSPIEVVVVDNASPDGTWEVLQRLAVQDARVRIFRNASNIGPVRNWRACVDQARGEYAKILWSDDLIAPDYLARCVPMLADPAVGFVYTWATVFSDSDAGTGTGLYNRAIETGIHPGERYIRAAFSDLEVPVSPGCALFRLKDLCRNLLVDVPNDLLIFLLTAADYPRFAVIDAPLSLFREHKGSITASTKAAVLFANYDLAKAYFAHSRRVSSSLLALLHVYLHIHLRRYRDMPYGLRAVGDFFPGQSAVQVAGLTLLRVELKRFYLRMTKKRRRAA